MEIITTVSAAITTRRCHTFLFRETDAESLPQTVIATYNSDHNDDNNHATSITKYSVSTFGNIHYGNKKSVFGGDDASAEYCIYFDGTT